ncbi:MAG: class I SAM-dependent rRNA methyltransferase [Limisphaerales bacterium]
MTATIAKPNLRLRITAAAEKFVRGGHPWVFGDSVREQNREGEAGELAAIFDRNDKFLAVGLYDPLSPIRVRVLHAGKPIRIDATWFKLKLDEALAKRAGLFDENTNGFRCINGESDGWPGLVLDRYANTYVLKIYTAAWLPRLQEVVTLLEFAPRLVLRLSRNIQELARTKFKFTDGQILRGDADDKPVVFLENGLRFEADVVRGQKSGFFLDQRENRKEVESLARAKTVLNAFSFSGGFSVYAARGGAKSVASLDISQHALDSAERNFALNPSLDCPREAIRADAFDWIKKSPRNFDLIVLDPPSLAKREAERAEAMRAYSKLIGSAIDRLNKNGVLVAASCSAHVRAEDFFEIARVAARSSARKFQELKTTRHAPDHPVTFPEGDYLKCIYLKF